MTRLGGIIYPTAYQMSDLIGTMSIAYGDVYKTQTQQSSLFEFFRYKNLEMGAWGGEIATNERKSLWAAFDGKIYNDLELKSELKKLGYQFAKNDAQLIVQLYDAWKEKFISRLNGYFAIALFDEETEELWLIRDRLGKKRLYWTSLSGYWIFASELKALLATGIVPQTPAIDGFASFLFFGYIPQDMSPVRGVSKVLPGHFVKVNLKRQSSIGQFWSYSALLEEKKSYSAEECQNQFGHLLEEAIRIRMPQQGPIGTFLDPNLGSTSMLWFLMSLTSKGLLRSFSATYSDNSTQDVDRNKKITDILHVAHEEGTASPSQTLKDLPKLVWHLDDPIANPYILQVWNFGQLGSRECREIFSAVGFEQMLAGHSRYFLDRNSPKSLAKSLANRLAHLPQMMRDDLLFPLLNFLKLNIKYKILRNFDINPDQLNFLLAQSLFSGKNYKKISPLLYHYFDPEVFTQRFHRLSKVKESSDAFLYFDAKTFLPDNLLASHDQIMNYYGLEMHTPFLDPHLVEFLATVPPDVKFANQVPGALLNTLMQKLCPEYPLLQPQLRETPLFPSFVDTWRKSEEFRSVFSSLKNGLLVEEGLISSKWLKQQLGYPYLIPSSFVQLFSILILEIWFRLFINSPIGKGTFPESTEELLS